MGRFVEEGEGRSHLRYPPGMLNRPVTGSIPCTYQFFDDKLLEKMLTLQGKPVLSIDGKEVGTVDSIVFTEDNKCAVASIRITDPAMLRRITGQ